MERACAAVKNTGRSSFAWFILLLSVGPGVRSRSTAFGPSDDIHDRVPLREHLLWPALRQVMSCDVL